MNENQICKPQVHVNGKLTDSDVNLSRQPSSVTPNPNDSVWGANFWVTLVDPQTGVSFFACPATGEVSWDPPVGNFLLPPNPAGEWWEMVDEQSGLPYYYHTQTGETVWERPHDFVIPLGVLQNTALSRRLSLTNRTMQALVGPVDKRISQKLRTSQTDTLNASFSRIRTLSEPRCTPSQRINQGDTFNSRPEPSRNSRQTLRRSISSEKRPSTSALSSPVSPLSYQQGHPLAPIPGSPYATDHSPPMTPTKLTLSNSFSKQEDSGSSKHQNQAFELHRDSDNTHLHDKDADNRIPRLSSKSGTPGVVSYQSTQLQSLNAALEMMTSSPSQSPTSTTQPGTTGTLGAGANIAVGNTDSQSASPTDTQSRQGTWGRSQSSKLANVPSNLKAKSISAPVYNAEATLNLSPVKTRKVGKPIPINHSSPFPPTDAQPLDIELGLYLSKRKSVNSGYPALPDDLASDIQQFSESQFARQYFSTHRTGFIFRRRVPVAQMMTWQKAPLSSPLLQLNKSLHKDAVRAFKSIQRIMGDRERERERQPHTGSTTSLLTSNVILEEQRWLLGEGLAHGELRDEIYCQIMKQVTGNPAPESGLKGWQLLCVLLVTFPPSKNFEPSLRKFMQQATSQRENRVDLLAKYCVRRLEYISRKGPRGKVPTLAEIETASEAAFNPSIFGESLDAIYRLQERTYPHLKIPIVLPFLADGILALRGTKSEGVFRVPGDGDTVSRLKLRIEKGYYNLDGLDDPHTLASLFKLWLRELVDPLIPEELYNDCIQHSTDPTACVQIVSRLPTINRRVMLFVISFLQLFLDDNIQSVTKMTAQNLALVMAPNLLRCSSESMVVVFTNAQYEQTFVYNLLLHLKCDKIDPEYIPTHGLGALPPSTH